MNKNGIGYYIIVVGIMYIVSAIILCISAGIIWKAEAPASAVSAAVIVTYIVSNFAGGFLAGKKAGKHRFVWGIIVSAIYFVIIILCSVWVMDSKIEFRPQIIGNALICIVSGMFGGMFAIHDK